MWPRVAKEERGLVGGGGGGGVEAAPNVFVVIG